MNKASALKRQKERNREQKNKEKEEERSQRREEKKNRPPRLPGEEDPDLAGIIPGPQPPLF